MSAGMRHIQLPITLRTAYQHLWALMAAADFHGRQCVAMGGQKLARVLRQETGLEGVDDRCEAYHLTFPH